MTRGRTPSWTRPHWREALLVSYAFRCASGLLLALPVVNAAQASGIAQYPRGDHLLFEPGGELLLEVLVSQRASLAAAIGPTLALGAILAVLALGPEFLLLRAAASSPPREGSAEDGGRTRAARPVLQRLLSLGLATLLGRGLLAGLSLALAFSARSWFVSARDPRVPDLVFTAVLAVGALAQLAVSALRDLIAATLVARGAGLPEAVEAALRRLRPGAVGAYSAAFGGTVLLVAAGALVAGALDVSQPRGWRIALVFAVHQCVVLGSIALRAAWLSNAVARVASDGA